MCDWFRVASLFQKSRKCQNNSILRTVFNAKHWHKFILQCSFYPNFELTHHRKVSHELLLLIEKKRKWFMNLPIKICRSICFASKHRLKSPNLINSPLLVVKQKSYLGQQGSAARTRWWRFNILIKDWHDQLFSAWFPWAGWAPRGALSLKSAPVERGPKFGVRAAREIKAAAARQRAGGSRIESLAHDWGCSGC